VILGRCPFLRVQCPAKKKMLHRLVATSAVLTQRRLLSFNTVKIAGQKQTVARSQLGDSDALASVQPNLQ